MTPLPWSMRKECQTGSAPRRATSSSTLAWWPGELGHRASSWPAVASTWLGTGSRRSPTVEVPVGSRSWVGTGTKGWGFALYDPATETYEPSGLPDGQPFGSAVEAYDTAAIVHLSEYAE